MLTDTNAVMYGAGGAIGGAVARAFAQLWIAGRLGLELGLGGGHAC
jgi:hypothetical protein